MGTTEFIIENSDKVLSLDKQKIRTIYAQVIGQVATLQSAQELTNYGINDLDKWSKKEKNVFAVLLKDNPQAQHIVYIYNREAPNANKIDRIEMFKQLATINKFLQAHPYSIGSFSKKANEAIIMWALSGKKNEINNFKEGLKSFIDLNTLENYIGADPKAREAAQQFIETKKMLNKLSTEKSTIGTTFTALAAVGYLTMNYEPIVTAYNELAPHVTHLFGSNPTVSSVMTVAAMGLVFYKSFELMHKAFMKAVDITKDKQIIYSNPKDMNANLVDGYISTRLTGDFIRNKNYDETNPDNQKYLLLSGFLNEKTYKHHLRMSPEIQKDLVLSSQQATRISNFKEKDIHELTTIQSPYARYLMATEDLNNTQKAILKNISNLESLQDKENTTGKYFDLVMPTNVSKNLEGKINRLDDTNKKIALYYLNAHMTQATTCDSLVLKNLEENLSNGSKVLPQLLQDALLIETANELRNKVDDLKTNPKNPVKENLKTIYDWVTGKVSMQSNNAKIKAEFDRIAHQYQLPKLEETNKFYGSLTEKALDFRRNVILKMQKIRDSIFANNTNINGNQP